jgi:phosphate starvation-inducible protein PhoH
MARPSRSKSRTSQKSQTSREIEEEVKNFNLDKSLRKRPTLSKETLQNNGIRLTEKQNDLYKGIRNSTMTVVHGPAGTSKAQPLSSPILTPTGWSTMGELNIGDKVVSSDGSATTVIGVFPQGKKDIWQLSFSDGTSVECCLDHLWLTQTESDRNNRKWSKTFNGQRSRYREQKQATVKSTEEIIKTLFTKRGRINHTIPVTSPVNFIEQSIEIHPYILGCLIGDGCLRNHVGFTTSDSEIIDTIGKLLDSEIKISRRSKYDYALIKKEGAHKNKIKKQLINIGLWGKLSDEKFIPDSYKYNSVENRISMLRGIMDTDGTVSNEGTYISFSSTSKRLVNDVKELVQSLGGIATDRKSLQGYYYKDGKKIFGKTSYSITVTMNPEINPFLLKRKSDKVVPKSRYRPVRYIVDAKYVGHKEAKCIKVDHESHLYLTNDYIVTHNTFTSCYTALALLADKKIEKIVITKPIQESGEQIGFLPGSISEKIDPYKKSYYTNFCKILDKQTIDFMFATEEIVFEPLAYMRGSTYDNCMMLLDECQNASIKQLMLWATRLGKDSKAVMMGDTSQYDVKKRDSGYVDFIKMTDKMSDLYIFEFKNEDIVRNKFLIELTNRYDKYRSENDM